MVGQNYGESGETIDTYEGPSVLSRGGTSVTGERAGRLVDFQFWGDASGIYDSGLAGLTSGPNGNSESIGNEYGVSLGGGVVGTRTWEHDQISLDYSGDWRHYTPDSFFDGTDQFLQFNWRHVLNRRLSMDVHEMGGLTSLSYGTLSYVPLRSADVFGLPQNLLFDTKTYFDQAGVEVFWQKSARLSIGIGGDGFVDEYKAASLVGSIGADARGDAVYRLTRRQKVYATYEYARFDYQHAFGRSSLDLAALGYSIDVGRNITFEVQGGAFYVNTLGLIQQPLPPAIAIILGTSYTTTTANRNVVVPDGVVRLQRRFRRSALNFGGAETVVPGNGVFLTSRSETVYGSYSYVGYKRMTLSATAGYSRLGTIGQQSIGSFSSDSAGGGGSYRLMNHLNSELRYDFYHYNTQGSGYRQNENRVTIGIAFSSGERPLALW